MKKKIAFVANCCITGGVETSLINLLNSIDVSRYEITLFTNFAGNPVIKNIPTQINCVDLDSFDLKRSFKQALLTLNLPGVFTILGNYLQFRVSHNWYAKSSLLLKHIKFNTTQFDCVIAYKYGITTTYIAQNAISSSKSLLWVHGELPSLESSYLRSLCSFDKCFCVSEHTKRHYLQYCQEMTEVTDIIHNLLDAKEIIRRANELVSDITYDRKYVFTTVGRLGQEKGQIIIPQVASMLAKVGIDFAWYVIGDGPEYNAIEREIGIWDMADHVYLLGTKENPYPYMKACDIYVQTSYSEGWCLTAQEAKILCKPIVTTDLPVMREQFTHMQNGYITNGISAEALYEGVKCLLDNPELCEKFTQNLAKEAHDNNSEMQKLYDFLDS